MKVSCLQENLHKGLGLVARAVASRSTLPVLNNILIATDQGRLKLAATDLTIGITTWIGAQIEEEGATTVPSKLLGEFVNSLPPEKIDMQLNVRTQTLNLKCSRFESNIKGMDAQEFPPIPTAGPENKLKLDPDTLRAIISQVAFAAAADESRPVLTGVLAKFDDGKITLAAADGFRLSVRTGTVSEGKAGVTAIIIPARALIELSRMIGDEEEPIEVTITKNRNQAVFHTSSTELVTQLVEGNYPDVLSLVPKSHNTRTVVGTVDFVKAVKLASFFARDASNIIRMTIEPGTDLAPGRMIVRAESQEVGDQVGEIDATVDGPAIEVAFNAKYLSEMLAVVDAAQVAIETNAPEKPGVFKMVGSDEFVHVIMPMHVNR
ncbi:MAG: DNA polymerase III subunit beta [Chloroflexi bacterium]|nr:DNA polymerase III subunit beta [Chloroflexota bacterium]MBI3734575.1 DNA polymerase III subunit beta [Chloroflexota bacterium]